MKRRNFINTVALTGAGAGLSAFMPAERRKKSRQINATFSQTDNKYFIRINAQVPSTKIFHITDTHLSIDDERGEKYKEYSARMADAYKSNPNFMTGEMQTAGESFEKTLLAAKEQKADFIALTGDNLSFPSEAGVEWMLQKLEETGIPFAYVAGNHDWHYEGMKGSSEKQRAEWTEKHLKPLYQGNNPLYAAYKINGLRFVCIDDSTYEILPEQLEFFKEQVKSGDPMVLMMHIPLYFPGRTMGYGCANPDWGEETDKYYEIERREKWRKGGHTKTTFDFRKEVFNAENLITILVGHTHHTTLDIENGITQIVSQYNASGYYGDLTIEGVS